MSRHRRSTDYGKKQREILSYFLFVAFVVLSVSACFRAVVVNPKAFSNMMTDSVYVYEMRKDVVEYAEDQCRKASIPSDFVSDVLRYNNIEELNRAYVENKLINTEDYNDYAYGVLLEQLEADLANGASQAVKDAGLIIDDKQKDEGARRFVQNIAEYLRSRVEFAYMEDLCNISQKGTSISVALLALSAVVSFCLIFAIFKQDGKKYRKLRNISISAAAASVFDFILFLAIIIVRITKDLVIYPSYLAKTVMEYVTQCMISVSMTSLLMMLLAIAMMASVWKLKRNEKE